MSSQSASVSFTPPADTGGSPITGYTAISTPGSVVATASSSPIIVPGLTNGTPYFFNVYATNANGDSPLSLPSNSVTPSDNSPTYQVPGSLRFTTAGSKWFYRNVTGANNKTFTVSAWVKGSAIVSGNAAPVLLASTDGSANAFFIAPITSSKKTQISLVQSSVYNEFTSVALFRDPAAWYHFVCAIDTTQAIASNRVKLYVNGVQQTLTTISGSLPVQNSVIYVNGNMGINQRPVGVTPTPGFYGDGQLADYYYIDGLQLDPSYFGQLSARNVWAAKSFTATLPFIQFPDSVAGGDPYWASTTALLHFNGTNGSTTIVDNASTPAAWTSLGTASLNTSQYKFGISSILFNGTTGYITSAAATDFTFITTGDYTVEWWSYFDTTTGSNIVSNRSGTAGYMFALSAVNSTTISPSYQIWAPGGQRYFATVNINVPTATGVWFHTAFVKVGTTFNTYVNGILACTFTTSSQPATTSNPLNIGRDPGGPTYVRSFMDDFRITLGVARYTSTFYPNGSYGTAGFYLPFNNTSSVSALGYDYSYGGQPFVISQFPDSAPSDPYFSNVNLLLHCNGANNSTSFIDNSSLSNSVTVTGPANISTAQSKFGGSSAYFNGTNPELSIATSTNFDLGATYTAECWIYPMQVSLNAGIMTRGFYSTVGTSWNGLAFAIRQIGSAIRFYFYGTTSANEQYIDSVNGSIAINTWSSISMVRSGPTGYAFINGTLVGQITGLNLPTASTQPLAIGNFTFDANSSVFGNISNNHFYGYIDDIRITKGIARYALTANNWTPNNISLTPGSAYDSMYDAPLGAGGGPGNGLGNYATLNPLMPVLYSATYTNANLTVDGTPLSGISSTQYINLKCYWEIKILANGSQDLEMGISTIAGALLNSGSGAYGWGTKLGKKWDNGVPTSGFGTATIGDIVGFAYDPAGTLNVYKNNVSVFQITGIPANNYFFLCGGGGVPGSDSISVNFGQQPFFYTPSSGFVALHTGNLSTPIIADPNQVFDATAYAGASSLTTQTLPFPDSVVAGDPYYANVSLLLHGTGANGGTTFTDSGPLALPITRNGAITTSTTQSTINSSSIYSAGSGPYLSLAQNAAFVFGTGDFTIEFWAYPTGTGGVIMQQDNVNAFGLFIRMLNNTITVLVGQGSGWSIITDGVIPYTTNVWTSIIVQRVSGVFYIFKDSTLRVTNSAFTTFTLTGASRQNIMGAYGGAAGFSGYITEFRITKGVARYQTGQQNITNAGAFQPDLVWIKSRSSSTNHELTDSTRSATKALTITSAPETTDSTGLTSFNSNGFTINSNTAYNNIGATYIAWQWKKASAAGFDMQLYTGTGVTQTISHVLGTLPTCIIIKSINTANWYVYHTSLGNNRVVLLDSISGSSVDNTAWDNTSPTNSVFTVGPNINVNALGISYMSYVFATVPGFSSFGSYNGNSSADGTFVYCGFKPRYIMIKNTTSSDNWIILDTVRDTYNVSGNLLTNTTGAEAFSTTLDILSNGFKLRVSTSPNVLATTYIYLAFAETPFKYTNAE